jgi:hypothetical protein
MTNKRDPFVVKITGPTGDVRWLASPSVDEIRTLSTRKRSNNNSPRGLAVIGYKLAVFGWQVKRLLRMQPSVTKEVIPQGFEP